MNDVLRCTKSNKLNLKFVVMGCTKSNKSPKVGEKKNAFVELVDLWKQDVNWKSNAKNNRKICIGFGISANSSNGILSYLAVHTSYYRIVMLSI